MVSERDAHLMELAMQGLERAKQEGDPDKIREAESRLSQVTNAASRRKKQ